MTALRNSNLLRLTVIGILLLSMEACRVGRVHSVPEMELPDTFEGVVADTNHMADIGWSTFYSDPILQRLIARALKNNQNLLIAAERIKELAAAKRIRFADMFPAVGVDVYANREYLNYEGKNKSYDPEIGGKFTIGWEVDLWGNLRRKHEAALAEYLQSIEAQKALQLTVVAQVAQIYFELQSLDRELEIVRQTLDARRQAVHFVKLRYDGGVTSEIPYRQSLVELARTETLIPKLEEEIKLKEHDMSVLLGEFPSVIPRGSIEQQKFLDSLPIDLPSSLLERRPDIRQAEERLRQANAEVGVAKTDMFPKLRLSALLGGENTDLSTFFSSPTWYVAGDLVSPLFQMGRKKAAYRAALAAHQQEVHRYQQTVLEVFKEVENALTSFNKCKEIRRSADALYRSASSYHDLAMLQYVNGIISYIEVLDAQRQMFDAEIAVNDAMLSEWTSMVALYKALGGGIQE